MGEKPLNLQLKLSVHFLTQFSMLNPCLFLDALISSPDIWYGSYALDGNCLKGGARNSYAVPRAKIFTNSL